MKSIRFFDSIIHTLYCVMQPQQNKSVCHQILATQVHAKAYRVTDHSSAVEGECPCCNQKIYCKQLALQCNPLDVAYLGVVFPIYFQLIKYLGVFLMIGCVFSIMNIILNSMGNTCATSNMICITSINNLVSTSEKDRQLFTISGYVNQAFIILAIFYFQFMSLRLKKMISDIACAQVSQSDYGVMVNYHHSYENKIQLLEYLRQTEKLYANICGSANKIIKYGFLQQKYMQGSTFKLKQQITGQALVQPRKQQPKLTQKLTEIYFYKNSSRLECLTSVNSKLIILFNSPLMTKGFSQDQTQELADPSDIIWANAELQAEQSKRLLMLIGVILLMLATFGGIVLIKQQVKTLQQNTGFVINTLLSLTVSTIVAVFNSIQGMIIRHCARHELYRTHSKFFQTVAKRLSYVFFLNMVLSTFLANFFILLQKDTTEDIWLPINYTGFINDFFFLFLTNSYMSSIFNYFDIFWGIKLYKRFKILKNNSLEGFSVQEAKFVFEGHPVDMGLRFGNAIKTLFFTATISPFVPAGTILSLIGYVIMYWVDKYLLLRRYTAKNKLNTKFALQMINFSKHYVVLFAFSSMFVNLLPLDNGNNRLVIPDFQNSGLFYISIMFLAISLFYKFIVPIIKSLSVRQSLVNAQKTTEYGQAELLFGNDKFENYIKLVNIGELEQFVSRLSIQHQILSDNLPSQIKQCQ